MSKLTQGVIIEAFWELLREKSMDKITVKEIVETAQINRNTFYYHFEDIVDLLGAAFQEESARFREEFDPSHSFYEEYSRAVKVFLQNRQAVIHIYDSRYRSILDTYMKEAADYFVSSFVKKAAEGSEIPEEGILYITNFYTYAIVGKTIQWIGEGMPDYNRNLVWMISHSFEVTVDVMIRDYIENLADHT